MNLKNLGGYTPLLCASVWGNLDIVKCLVEEGNADVHRSNGRGATPYENIPSSYLYSTQSSLYYERKKKNETKREETNKQKKKKRSKETKESKMMKMKIREIDETKHKEN